MKLVQIEHVSGFILRFFEFSIAVAVADRSQVGPETNVCVGIARARTCERTTITVIDGRPCVLVSASAVYFYFTFISYFLVLRLERLEPDVSFSGHCARRKKELEAEEARQTATKRVTTNGVSFSGSFKFQSMGSHSRYYFVTMLF